MDSKLNDLGYAIIGAAFEVRKNLGRYLYEKTYERALQIELNLRNIQCETQVKLPVLYKGNLINDAYKVDILVEGAIPIELKTLPEMGSPELSQILSYLTFGNFQLGYLINFWAPNFIAQSIPKELRMENGIYRIVKSELKI